MNYNPEIFKAYDIRGIYGQDFDADFAFSLGAALVRYINKKCFLVAHDDREFSAELADSINRGITSAGGDVKFLGLATTPFFNFVFKKLGVNAGVMLTASHLGNEYVGFKIFGEGGVIIGLDSGLEQIKSILIENKNIETARYGGKIIKQDRQKLINLYTDFIIKEAGWEGKDAGQLKINVKSPPTAKYELALLLDKSGLKNSDQEFDISFEFDFDADRIYVSDSAGQTIRSDYITGLLVQDKIRFWSKPKVVYDFRFSRGVLEKFVSWGIRIVRSKAGRAFMRRCMAKCRADIGGELSGHIYFGRANYNELPLLVVLRLLKIINKNKKNIGELVEQFKTWFNSGEINITKHRAWNMKQVFGKLKEKYKDGKVDELDGLTIEYDDPADDGASWWFNLRPSNTEPVLRLVVEAKTKNLLEEKVGEISELISSYSTGG